MKKTWIVLLGGICLLFGGIAWFNQNQTENQTVETVVAPIKLTEQEKEISELTLSYLFGYQFENLGEAEIRINLVHDGQIIQNYESFFSHENNPLSKVWVGFEKVDDLNYHIVLKQENAAALAVGKIEASMSAPKTVLSTVQFVYMPEKIKTSDHSIILGAVCLDTRGTSNLDDTVFDTSQLGDMQDLYNRLAQVLGCEYCYLIELYH